MPQTFLFQPFRLEVADERLWRGSQAMDLRPKTFAVLRYLVERPGRLVRHNELLDSVWAGTIVTPGTLNTSIRELRKALGDDARQPRFIETVHRRGFRFVAEVSFPDGDTVTVPAASSFVPLPMVPTPTGLHGRDDDLANLEARLTEARRGNRQVVLVTGDVGIGKTTLLRAFVERHAAETHTSELSVGWGQCTHRHGEREGFAPVLDAIERLIRTEGGEELPALLKRYAPTWVLQMPWLLEDGEARELLGSSEGVNTARMLREFHVMTEALTRERALVLVLEDVHWSDAATVDLIGAQARRADPARLLLIVTYRPVDAATDEHPIAPLHRSLRPERSVTDLVLGPLSEEAVGEYLCERFAWQQAPPGLPAVIHEQTDGNPLLMVTLTSHLTSNRLLTESDGAWSLSVPPESLAARAPEGLQAIVDDQLESLDREEREALEVASVAGDSFPAQVVAAGLGVDTLHLEGIFGRLAQWGQFIEENGVSRWPDGSVGRRFDFQHAAFQRILYGRLSPARRRLLHLRMAERVETAFAERLDPEAAELAVHYERGGDVPRAIGHLVRAAAFATRRLAQREAATYSRRAVELLATTARTHPLRPGELEVSLELGRSIAEGLSQRGADSEERTARSLELSRSLGDEMARRGVRGASRRRPDRERVGAALAVLPEDQREAVRLRYLAGQVDASEGEGTHRTATVSRVLEGLRQLGQALKPDHAEKVG